MTKASKTVQHTKQTPNGRRVIKSDGKYQRHRRKGTPYCRSRPAQHCRVWQYRAIQPPSPAWDSEKPSRRQINRQPTPPIGSAPWATTTCDMPESSAYAATEQAIEEDTHALPSLESATGSSSSGNTAHSGDFEMEIIQGRFWMPDEDDQDMPRVSVEQECLAGYWSNTPPTTVHDDVDWLEPHEESDTV